MRLQLLSKTTRRPCGELALEDGGKNLRLRLGARSQPRELESIFSVLQQYLHDLGYEFREGQKTTKVKS